MYFNVICADSLLASQPQFLLLARFGFLNPEKQPPLISKNQLTPQLKFLTY